MRLVQSDWNTESDEDVLRSFSHGLRRFGHSKRTLDSKMQPQCELKGPGTADLIQRIQSSQGTVQRVVSLAEEGRSIR